MAIKQIASLQHPLVKHWVELRQNSSVRKESGQVLIAGEKMVRELNVHSLITLNNSPIRAEEKYIVTEEILQKITGLKTTDGFAAIVEMPKEGDLLDKNTLLILDQLQDPGNVGTLFRTALAFGWDGVILTPGTVDPFNDKALRAGKGAQFHLPYANMLPEQIEKLKTHFYTADVKGTPLNQEKFPTPLALILSNEGAGAKSWSKKISKRITIPMHRQVESLNVATSGAILLYAMRPH